MLDKKREHSKEKSKIHPRNKHRSRYNFKDLIEVSPELAQFVKPNKYGDESVDFFNPDAVKALNKSLLNKHYGIKEWNIPDTYLCPPIPGRADYIHHIADVLASSNGGEIPTGKKIKCLDIGTGANCIYPIIGNREYKWSFIGSEIDPIAIEAAKSTIESNPKIKNNIKIRLQANPKNIFYGIINPEELVDLTICNPPFHASAEEAEQGTLRKLTSLRKRKVTKLKLNFGGTNKELWVEGGERKFVRDMIRQSTQFSSSCYWFSTLISKRSNLSSTYEALKKAGATNVKTIEMGQGTKVSRIVAWTFLTKEQQKHWKKTRWQQ